jgi:gliding motility-associated-like protein
MGTSGSTDFPVTSGAFDTSFNVHSPLIPVNLLNGVGVLYVNGSDIIVSKLDSSGSNLEASTFLGGTETDGLNNGANKFNYADEIRGEIDLDKNGKVYIASCTRSDDNPITNFGFQTVKPLPATNHIDGVIYKLNHNLSAVEWTNYIGGTSSDAAYSIAIDDSNDIYITGGTQSTNFPVTSSSVDTSYNGGNDGFIVHIAEDGNSILQSSFYGTPAYDQSYFVELDLFGNAHLFGQTSGPSGDLISNAMYNEPLGGQFLVKLTPELDSIIWATRFGSGDGTPDISPTAFLVDVCSAIYLSGWGSPIQGSLTTAGLDTAGGPMQGTTDGNDFYVMVMSDDANSLLYATFFGGSAAEHVDGGTSRFDRKGKVYQAVCAGCGGTSDFPTAPNPGAVSNTNNAALNGCNLAVFKIDFLLPIVIADFDAPTSGCAPFTVTFDNLSLLQTVTTFLWDFGDGTTSTQFEPTHTYTTAGVYTVKLIVSDAATCNLGDSLIREITILNNTNTTLPNAVACNGQGVQIGIPQNNDPYLNITWNPTSGLSDFAVSNPIATPSQNTTYTLVVDNGICFDTITQTVLIDSISTQISGDSSVCSVDAPFLLNSATFGSPTNYHWSNFLDFSDTLNPSFSDHFVWVTPSDSVNYYFLEVTSVLGCTAIDTFTMIQVDVQDPITASFADPGTGCAPYNLQFLNTSDSTAFTTYVWDFGNGNASTSSNPSTIYPVKGSYTVTLIAFDSSICPQSDTFSMQIQVRADSNYTVNDIACYGQDTEIGITADTVTGTSYTWIPTTGLSDPSIHNPTVNITQSTSYLLVVQHVCTDSVTNIITVEPIEANTDSLLIICSDNPVVNLTGNANGTGVEYVWSSQSNLSDTLNNSLTDSTMSATQLNTYQYYYFQVESPQGCLERDSTYVVVSDQTVTLSPDGFICQQDTLFLSATNNFPPNAMDFFWSPAADIIGQTDTTTIKISPLVDTYYYLTAINDSGCAFTDTVLISVSLLDDQSVVATADDDSVLLGFSTVLHAIPPTGYNYNWTPNTGVDNPDQANTSVTPQQTTTYTVWVTDPENNKCSYKNEVTVVVYEINCGEPDIFIPNAFSPNADGENDEYLIRGKVIESIDLKIYSRWGELVFETTDLNEGWDGTFNGTDVDPVVFVYQLTATCIDKREFEKKGNITVVR